METFFCFSRLWELAMSRDLLLIPFQLLILLFYRILLHSSNEKYLWEISSLPSLKWFSFNFILSSTSLVKKRRKTGFYFHTYNEMSFSLIAITFIQCNITFLCWWSLTSCIFLPSHYYLSIENGFDAIFNWKYFSKGNKFN